MKNAIKLALSAGLLFSAPCYAADAPELQKLNSILSTIAAHNGVVYLDPSSHHAVHTSRPAVLPTPTEVKSAIRNLPAPIIYNDSNPQPEPDPTPCEALTLEMGPMNGLLDPLMVPVMVIDDITGEEVEVLQSSLGDFTDLSEEPEGTPYDPDLVADIYSDSTTYWFNPDTNDYEVIMPPELENPFDIDPTIVPTGEVVVPALNLVQVPFGPSYFLQARIEQDESYFASGERQSIPLPEGSVELKKGQVAEVSVCPDRTIVRSVNGTNCTIDGQQIKLHAGEELTILNDDLLTIRKALRGFGHRRVTEHKLDSGRKVYLSEFSLLSFLLDHTDRYNKKVQNKILKTAAAIRIAQRSHGRYFNNVPKRAIAWVKE